MSVWKYKSLKTKDRQCNGHNETKQKTKHKTVYKSLQIRFYLIQATTQIRFNQQPQIDLRKFYDVRTVTRNRKTKDMRCEFESR